MAISQGLIDTYWRRYNQRKALTGGAYSYQEQRGALDPILEYSAKVKADEARLKQETDYRNRQLNMQEQAYKDSSKAATISGIAQTGGLLAQAGLGYKALQNQSANTAMMEKYLLGPSTTPTPEIPSAGMFAGPNPYSTPAIGAGSGGGILPAGVGSGAGTPMAGAAYPEIAGTAYPGAVGPMSAVGGEGAAITGGGAAPGIMGGVSLAGLGAAAGAYGLQYQTGKMTEPWMKEHGMEYTNKGWTYAGLPGATVGATVDAVKAVGSWVEDAWGHVF